MINLENNEKKTKYNVKIFLYVLITSLIIFLTARAGNDRLYTITSIIFSVVGVFIEPLIPLSINIIISPVALDTNAIISLCILLISIIPASYIFLLNRLKKIKTSDLGLILYASLFLTLSTIYGYKTNYITAVIQIITILQFLIISKEKNEAQNRLILFSLLLSGVYIAITVLIQLLGNNAVFLWGQRLTFDGSVRTLATVLGFPIYYLISKYILSEKRKYGIFVEISLIIILILMIVLLIMTYSRGVLIAIIFALAYITFTHQKKLSFKRAFIYFLLFGVSIILIANIEIDTDLMFGNLEGGNGRTDIWKHYYNSLSERGAMGYLIGLGPGESQRITEGTQYSGFYAHSAIFDYFFSYGLMGLIFILCIIIKGFMQACKYKNTFAQGLLVLTVLMFITSNTSSSAQMHIMLALVYSTSIISYQEKDKITERNNSKL